VTTNEAGISRSAVQTAGVTRVDIKGTPPPGTLRGASISYRHAGQMQLLSQCRSLFGHFSHSVQAKQRLRTIQQSIQGHPVKKLLQDVSTRWNLTYYMTKRLIEQEKALAAYEREYSLPACVVVPPGLKFKWLKQLCDLLEPMEEATRRMCTDAATAADVILPWP